MHNIHNIRANQAVVLDGDKGSGSTGERAGGNSSVGMGMGGIDNTFGSSDHNCEVLLVRTCVSAGERAALMRKRQAGQVVAVARGAYVDAMVWASLDRHAKYRVQIRAAAESLDSNVVFSHASAAALWQLPWVGEWPSRVHTTGASAAGGRSKSFVFRHSTGEIERPEMIDGLRVTSLAKTVVDVARTNDFGTGVTVADAGLRRMMLTIDDFSLMLPSNTSQACAPQTLTVIARADFARAILLEELALVSLRQGSAKARAVIEFADVRADRPGESMSRVNMLRARLPTPQLQVPLRGASGRTWIVDFWWPAFNLIGEFDGQWKYSDPTFLKGRTPHMVLLEEKFREDDLRAAGHSFSRWGWAIAMSPSRLKSHLNAAGLR